MLFPELLQTVSPVWCQLENTLFQKDATCPKIFPAAVPVSTCNLKPIYRATTGSSIPIDTPMTEKNVPVGVFETISTITSNPDIAQAEMKPATVQ